MSKNSCSQRYPFQVYIDDAVSDVMSKNSAHSNESEVLTSHDMDSTEDKYLIIMILYKLSDLT